MLCCLLLALFTETFEGKVVGVTDGDTITILDANNQQKKCRLANIDAPETRGQAFGQAAKAHLSEKIFGKHVVIESSGLDGFKRYISTVKLGNRNINLEMVKEGYAWCYRQYCKDGRFYTAEEDARSQSLGLWSGPAIPPWDFRKMPSSSAKSSSSSKNKKSTPSSNKKNKK